VSKPRLRWGLIGAGRIAHTFARDIVAVDNAELVAVAAREGSRARAFADEYGVEHAHEGYLPLYENPDVDAVYVATPHSSHLQNCTDAMNHGKAVLCEKPLVLNPAECRELISVSEESGSYLMEGMWTWYLPVIRLALAWYQQGRIGELLHIKADFGFPLPYSEGLREYDARVGGGAVLEMGVYPVAIARLFAARAPANIHAVGRRAANHVEDDVSAIFDYGDCMATLGTSFRCKLHNWAYIIGTKGLITIPDFWRAERCSLYALDQRIDHFEDNRNSAGFDYQIRAVSQDILDGKIQSDIIPLATSLALQEDMLAIREAIPSPTA